MSTPQSAHTTAQPGRPLGSSSLRTLAARKAAAAIEALAAVASDPSAPPADRVQAARALLDVAQPAPSTTKAQ